MPVEKKCVVCGETFSVPPSRALTAKACSNTCAIEVRAKSRERKVLKVCAECGLEFEVPRSHGDRYNHCSTSCRLKHGWRSGVDMGMENNPGWKGGETNHSGGYVYSRNPHHPFSSGGYVFKHRLIVEARLLEVKGTKRYLVKLGSRYYLSPDWQVHHLDGDRKNNAIKNLLVCSCSTHSKLHGGTMPEPGTYWPPEAKIILGKKPNKE